MGRAIAIAVGAHALILVALGATMHAERPVATPIAIEFPQPEPEPEPGRGPEPERGRNPNPSPSPSPGPSPSPNPSPNPSPSPSPNPNPNPIQSPTAGLPVAPELGSGSGSGFGSGSGPGSGSSSGAGSGSGAGAGSGSGLLRSSILARIRASRRYPELARRGSIEGTVTLRFRIHPDGQPYAIATSGGADPLLNEAARDAVLRAAPLPYLDEELTVDLAFILDEPASE